ncbi:MAG: hypothetical protein DWQ04_20820 [Chloroflexi bacterium]|nr:MAG: hypothetical protein DWQ04_20820 [Chloroflexota bacterium]
MFRLRRAAVGGTIGLLIGILFTLFVNFVSNTNVSLATLGGPLWVLIAAFLIGLWYAVLFEPHRDNYAENVSTGLVLGIILWFVWAISLQPFLVGKGESWQAVEAITAVPKLITYILQGGLVGFVYGLLFGWLAKSLKLHSTEILGPPEITKRVVIIGGGYAGVSAAQVLEKELAKHPAIGVTLVSQNNFLIHTPMLSEVSASAVNAQNISPSLRSFFKNVQVIQSDIANIDLDKRIVHLRADTRSTKKDLHFDHLILTAGSVPNFFGNKNIEKEAFSFKSLEDATIIRNQIIDMFERADLEPNSEKRKQMLTFVVAGGGFAGVELLGGMNDFARGICFYYPNVNPADVRTVLVHSRERILPELSEALGEFAKEKLIERGVEFQLGVRVTDARPGFVVTGEQEIPSNTFIWTAGNRPSHVLSLLDLPLTKRGQLEVNTALQVLHTDNIWAAGDCAQVPDLTTGKFAPPTAQHALREGKVAGYNVAAALTGKPLKTFKFKTLGSLAALGHQLAVAEVFGRRFSGFFAWLLWRGIYLSKLPTLQKQVRVLLDWILDVFFPPDIVQTINFSQKEREQQRVMTEGNGRSPEVQA